MKEKLLIDGEATQDMIMCHYPAAIEFDGMLYVIATASYKREDLKSRGAVLFTIDLKNL
ncbi:MAG: hypothetical protein IJX80_10265 [Clostridia bacterium]|nr:hypothetical protein [Clostridia bacterium]